MRGSPVVCAGFLQLHVMEPAQNCANRLSEVAQHTNPVATATQLYFGRTPQLREYARGHKPTHWAHLIRGDAAFALTVNKGAASHRPNKRPGTQWRGEWWSNHS